MRLRPFLFRPEYSHDEGKAAVGIIICITGSQIDEITTAIESAVFGKLCIALYHNRWINITLDSNADSAGTAGTQDIEVMPLGLVVTNQKMSLAFKDRLSPKVHHVPLTRVLQLKVSTYTFDYPAGFDISHYATSKAHLNHSENGLTAPENRIKPN